MYRAKRAQSRSSSSTPDIEDEAPRRLVLVTALKRAIDVRTITMHYQPKFELARGGVVGWRRSPAGPTRRSAPCCPTTFVPLAERTGLAEPLTELALEIAAADCAPLARRRLHMPGRVNVPARVLLDPGFPDLVEAKRLAMGLEQARSRSRSPRARSWATTTRRARRSAACGTIGVRTSIDDFGTGYSSLSYLRAAARARAQDRPLLHHGPLRRARLRGDRPLDHRAGAQPRLETVAEGVEDERVCERLVRLGCDYAQGFALARPMPADAMRRWLRTHGSLCRLTPVLLPGGTALQPRRGVHLHGARGHRHRRAERGRRADPGLDARVRLDPAVPAGGQRLPAAHLPVAAPGRHGVAARARREHRRTRVPGPPPALNFT